MTRISQNNSILFSRILKNSEFLFKCVNTEKKMCVAKISSHKKDNA